MYLYNYSTITAPIMPEAPEQALHHDAVEWQPLVRKHGICTFAVAVASARELLVGVVHNANWAVAHGGSFTLFLKPTNKVASNNHMWDRVSQARRMMHRPSCAWLMHIDADAVVAEVGRGPMGLLKWMEKEAVPDGNQQHPVMYTTCNSPLGRGLDCDADCCGRTRKRSGCAVGLRDVGPSVPYP